MPPPKPSLVQQALKRFSSEAGGAKAAGCTPSATYLLERGQNIPTIQELLCHQDVSSTMIYTQVLNPGPISVRSPGNPL